jgi:hypothetical protein
MTLLTPWAQQKRTQHQRTGPRPKTVDRVVLLDVQGGMANPFRQYRVFSTSVAFAQGGLYPTYRAECAAAIGVNATDLNFEDCTITFFKMSKPDRDAIVECLAWELVDDAKHYSPEGTNAKPNAISQGGMLFAAFLEVQSAL